MSLQEDFHVKTQALVPTLQVFKEYFDAKYPCTYETNDGSQMPIADEMKYETYNYLLSTYNKCKELFDESYKASIKKLSDAEVASRKFMIRKVPREFCKCEDPLNI